MRSPSTRPRTAAVLPALALALTVVATPSAGPVLAAGEGTLDPDFGTSGVVRIDVGTGSTDALHAVAIDSTGRIVAAGTSGTSAVVVRRLADGSPDTSFDGDGILDRNSMDARALALTADGGVLVAGTSGNDFMLLKLLQNGAFSWSVTMDIGASTGGAATVDEALAVAVDASGRILIAGRAGNDLALARYTSAGVLDTTFGGGDGITLTSVSGETSATGRAIAVEADGRILVAGDASGDTALLIRYDASGSVVTTRLFGGNASPTAFRDIELLEDGRVLAVGQYGIPTPAAFGLVVRYTAALSLDNTLAGDGDFTVSDGGSPTNFNAAAVQRDGRFLVGGSDASGQLLLRRYEADSDGDGTFGLAGGFIGLSANPLDTANAMAVQADGNIVIAGTEDNGVDTDLLIARVLGTPTVAARTEAGPSYDTSILDAPVAGTARLTRRDGTFVLPGSSSAAGRVTYTHEELTATLLGTAATSAQGGLVGDGGGEVVVELSGALTPDGVIEVWTASTPRLTAAHRITAGGADGEVQRFAVPLVAPLDAGGPIAPGAHVLQLVLPTGIGRQVLDVTLDVRDGATGPVPTAIPAGDGPAGPVSPSGADLLALALAGVVAVRVGRGSLRRPRAVRAGAR